LSRAGIVTKNTSTRRNVRRMIRKKINKKSFISRRFYTESTDSPTPPSTDVVKSDSGDAKITRRKRKISIEFYFDVSSPWSYIANVILMRYKKLKNYPFALIFKPIFLGGLFNVTGNKFINEMIPSRKKYFNIDMERFAQYSGIPFKYPTVFPVNTVVAQRILLVLLERKNFSLVTNLISKFWPALWANDQDISKDEVITSILKEAGMKDDEIKELKLQISSEETKNKLKTLTQEAADKGVFGVPTFIVRRKNKALNKKVDELYFGADRLFMLFKLLGLRWRGPNPTPERHKRFKENKKTEVKENKKNRS